MRGFMQVLGSMVILTVVFAPVGSTGLTYAQEINTLRLVVSRLSPTGTAVNVASGAAFSVTFRIGSNNTGGDVNRTFNGTYMLTFSGVTVTGGSPTAGSFMNVGNASPTDLTFNFQAPAGPASGTIMLSASTTSTSAEAGRTNFCPSPSGPGDVCSDTASYNVSVAAPALRSTMTGVTCGSPVPVNAPSTCTATVTDTSATPITPTGSVSWTGGAGMFSGAPCTLSGSGASASCQVTYTPNLSSVGTHTIGASYGGDPSHSGSNGSFMLNVIQRTTSTGVSCAPNPVPVNAPTTCTATVMDTSAGTVATPTGNVTWSNVGGTFSSSSCSLGGSGASASCQITYTPNPNTVGTHTITANYAGDPNHSGSSGNFMLTVIQRTTSTMVACSPPAIFLNGNTTCTATVTDTTAAGTAITPTGMVTFMSSLAGTFTGNPCTLSGSGASASCSATFNATAVGTHTITGTYPGDANHSGSGGTASLAVTYNFQGFFPPIMITNPAPGLNGVRAGSTVPVKFRLLDANGAYVTTLSAVVSIQVVPIHCSNDAVIGDIYDATATGGTGLRYDATDNQYVYNWQTQRPWAGMCQRLLLNLDDGTQKSADFQLR